MATRSCKHLCGAAPQHERQAAHVIGTHSSGEPTDQCPRPRARRVLRLVSLRLQPRLYAGVVLEAQARVILYEGGLVIRHEVERAPLCKVSLGEAGREREAGLGITHLPGIGVGLGAGVEVRGQGSA